MRYQGRITSWKDDKGFGFITPNGGTAQVFVHINAFTNRRRRPTGDEIVTYELKVDDKGRAQAAAVTFLGDNSSVPRIRSRNEKRSSIRPLFAVGFMTFVAAWTFVGKQPKEVLFVYAVASVVAFLAYGLDKSAARHNQWRTKERTLHLIALLGGWPGALLAQRFLHHKSKKATFQAIFWSTVVANCSAFGWLQTPAGASALRSILGTG